MTATQSFILAVAKLIIKDIESNKDLYKVIHTSSAAKLVSDIKDLFSSRKYNSNVHLMICAITVTLKMYVFISEENRGNIQTLRH